MLICLHIGAHKTATTYIQSRLLEERSALVAKKVAFIPQARYRKASADRMDALEALGGVGYAVARRTMERALGRMVDSVGDMNRLILSDENVAGPLSSAIGASGLYPDVKRRLTTLIGALAGHEVQVFFSVRSYADFFNSIYAYRVGQRKTQDVETFRERARSLTRGWREVVADICETAGPERTVVWTHEEFARSPERIGAALIGDFKPRVLVKTDKASLPSLTRKGMAVLDRASDILSAEEYAGLARVVARYPFEAPDEKFTMFDTAETAALSRRYAEDVAAMGGLGCRLIVESLPSVEPAPPEPAVPVAPAPRRGGSLQERFLRLKLRGASNR